jgi:hypothetical protein
MTGIARPLAALMLLLALPQQAGAAGFGWSY